MGLFGLYLLQALSGGLLYLACRWFPQLELFLSAKKDSFMTANLILARNNWNQIEIIEITVDSTYNGQMFNAFPNFVASAARNELGVPLPEEYWNLIDVANMPLHELRFITYRYHSLVFNPISLEFQGVSEWRDLKWDNVERLLEGVVCMAPSYCLGIA